MLISQPSLLWSNVVVCSSALKFFLFFVSQGGLDGCCPALSLDTPADSPANRSPYAGSPRALLRGSYWHPHTLTPA